MLVIQGASMISKLFRDGGPSKGYPWHVKAIPGRPGFFKIEYGTKSTWFPVWSGSVEQVFGQSRFDVSGNTNRGQWRAYRTAGGLQILEFVNNQWYPMKLYSESRMQEITGYTPPSILTGAAGLFEGGLDSSNVPLLIAGGLALILTLRK